MRFKQFLTEQAEFNIDQFKIDCQFFLDRAEGGIMWHGAGGGPADFEVRTWKPRIAPRDSLPSMHTRINQFAENKFGAPIRNWMFASGLKAQAQIYSQGKPCFMIFPIGEFEWVSGINKELDDLTSWHTQMSMDIGQNTGSKGRDDAVANDKLATDFMLNKMAHMKWYHNQALDKCISNKNEIMIKCNKFYFVSEAGAASKLIRKIL